MTRCHRFSCTSLLLSALLIAGPQLTSTASLPATAGHQHSILLSPSSSSSSNSADTVSHDNQIQSLAQAGAIPKVGLGATRTHRRGDDEPLAASPSLPLTTPQQSAPFADVSAAWVLASLLMDSIDHPRKQVDERDVMGQQIMDSDSGGEKDSEEGEVQGRSGTGAEQGFTGEEGEQEESVETLREEVAMAARELADSKERSGEDRQWDRGEGERSSNETWESRELRERQDRKEEQGEEEKRFEDELDTVVESPSRIGVDRGAGDKLQRETRGFFQNIDLGLQDNEILPPLKGYKAYNRQLAQATKKLKWQEEKTKEPAPGAFDRNFMDDFDFKQGADREEEDEDLFGREDEEAQARAEKEELQRQQAEAEAAREEEQRLADIASDMLLEYMDRKQQTAYMEQRQKGSILGDMAEDKRSNEVLSDDDNADGDLDLQTIDRLIEISSKLHLPADDVVEIISDVEEKKRKKDTSPPVSVPRFRPLVAPPRPPQGPIYKYTPVPAPPKISKPPKPLNPYKKWYKQKGKSKQFKQDYWFKPAKQFMAYPSYLYYQKPYRAYYPVYFPPPKPRLYTKPAFAYDYNFADSLDYGLKPPKRRNMNRQKGKGQSWKLMARGPPASPYISNYILPHPRTYYSLPMPKPQPPAASPRRPAASSYYYPPDYDTGPLREQQESDEELENFIEKMYFHRRIF